MKARLRKQPVYCEQPTQLIAQKNTKRLRALPPRHHNWYLKKDRFNSPQANYCFCPERLANRWYVSIRRTNFAPRWLRRIGNEVWRWAAQENSKKVPSSFASITRSIRMMS